MQTNSEIAKLPFLKRFARVAKLRGMYETLELNSALYFQNLGVEDIDELPAVQEAVLLFLENNVIRSVETLRGFPSLKVLSLSSNRIEHIELKRAFGGVPGLEQIHLCGNALRTIEWDGSFEMASLRILKLNRNRFTQLPICLFAPNLEVLDVSDNSIEGERDSAFDSLLSSCVPKSLKQLYLYGNPLIGGLKQYRARAIQQLPELTYLDRSFVDRELAQVQGDRRSVAELHSARSARIRTEMRKAVDQMKVHQICPLTELTESEVCRLRNEVAQFVNRLAL